MMYNRRKNAKGDEMNWYKRLRDLREDHDMTLKTLANILEISERTLSRYEAGVCEPTISTLIKISLLFNVSIDYIAGIKDIETITTTSVKEELSEISEKINEILKLL